MWKMHLAPDGSLLEPASSIDLTEVRLPVVDPIEQEAALAAFDAPVTIHRVFVEICGSLNAAAILTDLSFIEREDRPLDDWIEVHQELWVQRLGLSRKEQVTARRLLLVKSFIEETRSGVPPRLFFRIQWYAINKAIREAAKARVAGRQQPLMWS